MEITLEKFNAVMDQLEKGEVRVAYKENGEWKVNAWVKEVILAGFRLGKLVQMGPFVDKDTFPVRDFTPEDGVRVVPGGSAVRRGAYMAPGSIIMPPAYVNAGAFVDSGSMVDSHVTIGSCAQVGKNVHVSASSQIGGVLEPAGALPTIIEDGAFVGGNCGIYEGTIVQEGAVIASGVIITSSTPLFDSTTGVHKEKCRRPHRGASRSRGGERQQARYQRPRSRGGSASLLPGDREVPRLQDRRFNSSGRPA